MKKQIEKAKTFIKEHKTQFIAGTAVVTSVGLAIAAYKAPAGPKVVKADDVTDEEWQAFVDAAKLLDEQIAARKAEKNN